MTNGPLGQCNTCVEIYRHSPVIQHVCSAASEDEATRLRTALTASLAREAAAFEAAAKECDVFIAYLAAPSAH